MAEEQRGRSTVCVWHRWLSERGPFDKCTGDGDKDNEGEHRGVDIIAELDGADGWEWELRGVEG